MAEEKTPEQIAAEVAAAQAAADAAGAGAGGTTKTVEELQAELARTAAALHKANKEAQKSRQELDTRDAAEVARQQAEMTELERLKAERETLLKELATAKEQANETLIKAAFVAEAARAGVAHPDDVYLLADRSEVAVNDGKVEGVADAVKALVDAGRVPMAGRPPAPKTDGGAGGRESSGQTVKLTPLEIETARRMGVTVEKYAAQKAALAKDRQVE